VGILVEIRRAVKHWPMHSTEFFRQIVGLKSPMDVLHIPPISGHGQPAEIVQLFGGAQQLREAVTRLQTLLYSA